MRNALYLRLFVLAMCLAFAAGATPFWPAEVVLAQDDDDDDDDGNDDDDDDGGRDGADRDDDDDDDRAARTSRGEPRRQRRAAPPPVPVELPLFAPGEIVTLALTEADLAALLARGYRVLEQRAVPEIGIVSRRLAIPDGTTLEAARTEVRALPSGTDADFNHYYRTEQSPGPAICEGPHCASLEQIGWAVPLAAATCAADIAIGVIDTGINADHPTFAAARLTVRRLAPEGLDPSRAVHGTAVIALLIGDPASRSPGLLPGTRVVAVDAFHRQAGDERADVFSLAAAVDFLAGSDVGVVNMSLAGPPNTVLERAIAALAARNLVVVAAAGNAGPMAEPAYPAAYPDVLAVTAVDRGGEVYRRAGRGSHVDLAAPGVEVWTAASVRGARPKTGTSLAAPFVTAAAASLLAADPTLPASEIAARLNASARDLGEPGHDDVYGHGLVQAARRCRP